MTQNNQTTLDVAIIGTGPAALSAALTLQLHQKAYVLFGPKGQSIKVEKAEQIANYPGFPGGSGRELNRLFETQIQQSGIRILEKKVTQVMPMNPGFMVLGDSEVYQAQTVLFATGAVSPKGFDGEEELLGRGVSYCATCDGFLYRGKTIAVYCAQKEYEAEVTYLAGLADKVYLFTPYRDCNVTAENVIRLDKSMRKICGEGSVQGVELADGTTLAVDGVFLLRNAIAHSKLLPGLQTEGAHVVVDRQMRTNVEGCFAAGDCTGRPYQIAKAVGEGNVAAHAILEYLSEKERGGSV